MGVQVISKPERFGRRAFVSNEEVFITFIQSAFARNVEEGNALLSQTLFEIDQRAMVT